MDAIQCTHCQNSWHVDPSCLGRRFQCRQCKAIGVLEFHGGAYVLTDPKGNGDMPPVIDQTNMTIGEAHTKAKSVSVIKADNAIGNSNRSGVAKVSRFDSLLSIIKSFARAIATMLVCIVIAYGVVRIYTAIEEIRYQEKRRAVAEFQEKVRQAETEINTALKEIEKAVNPPPEEKVKQVKKELQQFVEQLEGQLNPPSRDLLASGNMPDKVREEPSIFDDDKTIKDKAIKTEEGVNGETQSRLHKVSDKESIRYSGEMTESHAAGIARAFKMQGFVFDGTGCDERGVQISMGTYQQTPVVSWRTETKTFNSKEGVERLVNIIDKASYAIGQYPIIIQFTEAGTSRIKTYEITQSKWGIPEIIIGKNVVYRLKGVTDVEAKVLGNTLIDIGYFTKESALEVIIQNDAVVRNVFLVVSRESLTDNTNTARWLSIGRKILPFFARNGYTLKIVDQHLSLLREFKY